MMNRTDRKSIVVQTSRLPTAAQATTSTTNEQWFASSLIEKLDTIQEQSFNHQSSAHSLFSYVADPLMFNADGVLEPVNGYHQAVKPI